MGKPLKVSMANYLGLFHFTCHPSSANQRSNKVISLFVVPFLALETGNESSVGCVPFPSVTREVSVGTFEGNIVVLQKIFLVSEPCHSQQALTHLCSALILY
jgi:hypothetical protein